MHGKIALVTGGIRGLGKNMAQHLARKGVDVIVTYHSRKAEAEKQAAEPDSQPAAEATETTEPETEAEVKAETTETAETVTEAEAITKPDKAKSKRKRDKKREPVAV